MDKFGVSGFFWFGLLKDESFVEEFFEFVRDYLFVYKKMLLFF